MRIAVQKSAFSRNADGCEDIVSCHHDGTNVGIQELLQHGCRRRLQLVLENNEPDKVEPALDFGPGQLLRLDPAKFRQVPRRAADDSIPLVGVVGKLLVVIARDWSS